MYNKEDFILNAREIHGNKYNYDLLPNLFRGIDKVPIVCNVHGEFYQIARNHIHGVKSGCPKCGRIKANKSLSGTFESFVEKARKVHGKDYDYIENSYIKTSSKLKIKCNKCGTVFEQKGTMHLIGHGCPVCNHAPTKLDTEKLRKRLLKTHPNLKLLSEYKGSNELIRVRCVKHDYVFNTTPHRLQEGNNCQKCYDERRGNTLRKPIKQLHCELHKVHGMKYSFPYIEKEYKNNKSKITVVCPKHGEFKTSINKLLIGHGCPVCNESHLEVIVNKLLTVNNVTCIRQKKFDWLKNNKTKLNLSLDFYLPDYNIGIECQGEQHFKPVSNFGGETAFQKVKYRDILKYSLCVENGFKLIYITSKKYKRHLGDIQFERIYRENVYFIEDMAQNKKEFNKTIEFLLLR